MRTKTFSKQTIVVAVFMLIASLLTSCRLSRNTSDMPYVFPIDLGDLCLEGYVDKDPVFPGDSLRDYIRENMVYPADALKDSIQGVVIVQFTVEKDGSITDVKALKQVHPLLDAEAVRLFSEMPKWEPGMLRDTLRRVQMLRSVHFRLRKSVDLGLSVKWATCNVGANKPEEYGDYYAWGETEPKESYTWENYRFRTSGYDEGTVRFSKYTSIYYNGMYDENNRSVPDDKTLLEPEDDVAHVKWGGNWRLPTREEFYELIDSCTWTWTTVNGVNGCLVTSNRPGYTDRSIFLPATGRYAFEHEKCGGVGKWGYYWSSSVNSDHTSHSAANLSFGSSYQKVLETLSFRNHGLPVRPVHP